MRAVEVPHSCAKSKSAHEWATLTFGVRGLGAGGNYLYGGSAHFSARGCFDSTPLNVPTGKRQPGCVCRCSMWARAPRLDSLSACTGPWQCLQRMS